jgi:hypothetical protein
VPHDPLADADPAVGVGSVHHIVPKVYLRRFADERERITVVDRVTGLRRDAHVDQAHRQKDFYTFVNTDGESDGRVEQLLASVEGQAATALRNTFHPVFGRWPPMGEHRLELIQFVAFQFLRGRRHRREMEMMADFWLRFELSQVTKANVRDFLRDRGVEPTPEAVDEALTGLADLDDLEFAPQNNHYVESMLRSFTKASVMLAQRRMSLVEWEEPCLVTCDEPVLLLPWPDTPQGIGVGIQTAMEVWLPLDPHRLLVLAHERVGGPEEVVSGEGVSELIESINMGTIANSYECAFMRPGTNFPGSGYVPGEQPIMSISGGGLGALDVDRYNSPAARRNLMGRYSNPNYEPPGAP